MALIETIPQNEASGVIKEGYLMFAKHIGMVPKPFELLSASPGLFELQLNRNKYYGQHPRLSFALLAHIRYLVSKSIDNSYCIDFNRMLLSKIGMSDADIDALAVDPAQSMLEERETAMLTFVVNAVKDPGPTTAEEISRLREMGWQDSDMLDALAQGAGMLDVAILMKTFRMDHECLAK